jgi:hypothetical protein
MESSFLNFQGIPMDELEREARHYIHAEPTNHDIAIDWDAIVARHRPKNKTNWELRGKCALSQRDQADAQYLNKICEYVLHIIHVIAIALHPLILKLRAARENKVAIHQ